MNHMEDEKFAGIEFIVAEKIGVVAEHGGGCVLLFLLNLIKLKNLYIGKIIVRCNLTDSPYSYIINTY